MRTGTPDSGHSTRRRGILLVECLVYVAVFSILSGVAFAAFYRCYDTMKGCRRNAEDIVHALRAGEQWREDVRSATGPIHSEAGPQEQLLRIPHPQGEVGYKLSGGAVQRQGGEGAPWVTLLPKVKDSRMQTDRRTRVTAWEWELELQPTRQAVRVRPMFTFRAVPRAATQP